MGSQVLLINCPESGKTTTLIRRIKSMIDSGIDSAGIVMVTFTDAAASEMKERFQRQFGAGIVVSKTLFFCEYKI